MTDQATGDMPWMQQTAPAIPAAVREPRQKRLKREAAAPKPSRKPRAAKSPAEAPVAPAPKKPRKTKKEKAERAAPDTIKVTLKEYAGMRVGPDDAKLFLKLHGLLSLVSKGTRAKVLGELAKVFG